MSKLWLENNGTQIKYQALSPDNDDSTFTDYTNDLSKWDEYGQEAKTENGSRLEYKRMRDFVAPIVYALTGASLENWGTVTQETREFAAKYILVPYSLRVSTLSESEDVENFTVLYVETKGVDRFKLHGRKRILEEMFFHVAINYYRNEGLSQVDANDFTEATKEFSWRFENYSSPDLKNWLCNVVGTDYENDGFAEKSYFDADLRDELIGIYNGNY